MNTEIDNGTDAAALMKILKNNQLENDERFQKVCNRIRYFKEVIIFITLTVMSGFYMCHIYSYNIWVIIKYKTVQIGN